ncbi:deoxyribodipyrimidine photo-lyase [Rhinocladiella mackenziei CBS 650.93]|uniref:Deoxyribodipyrimidine photo-lyase n=1 Tax=Rhinocladiella mackenziei CBS 650.93 TaxID=1442369 RepID=A0A0D2IN57_9EURO|nr:deoxyribodipyrimidine photo-lyase [Rhinocladiella mackenziei CBS 650.93]KIX04551.1 deoxyribodipyrimidine photo-lyase [Rhinocladiella mackenziei CBS 650.93]
MLSPYSLRIRPTYGTKYPELFSYEVVETPASKNLSEEEEKFHSMWPSRGHTAYNQLKKFLLETISKYDNTRKQTPRPMARLRGTLSAQRVVREAGEAVPQKKLTDDRKQGTLHVDLGEWHGETFTNMCSAIGHMLADRIFSIKKPIQARML